MRKYVFVICFLACTALLIISCKTGGKSSNVVTEGSDTAKFFPVVIYLKGQVEKADSFATAIYKITIENGKRDSMPLTRQQFNEWAQLFLRYDLSDKSIHRFYKENVFLDQTTNSYTFDYKAQDSSLPLQEITVLLDATKQTVSRVFLNEVKTSGNTTITQKAGWKNDESFYVNRITDNPDTTVTQQNIIVWKNEP